MLARGDIEGHSAVGSRYVIAAEYANSVRFLRVSRFRRASAAFMRAKYRSRFELVTSAFGEALRDRVVDRARECIARRLRRHLRDLNLQRARRLLQCRSSRHSAGQGTGQQKPT